MRKSRTLWHGKSVRHIMTNLMMMFMIDRARGTESERESVRERETEHACVRFSEAMTFVEKHSHSS